MHVRLRPSSAGSAAVFLVLLGMVAVIADGRLQARVFPHPRIASSSTPRPAPTQLESPPPERLSVTVPAGPNEPPVAFLDIPKLGIRGAPIFNRPTDPKGNMLIAGGYSVTHYTGSPMFGSGNSVLYGHDDIQGSIFARLADMQKGDEVRVSYRGETQVYKASAKRFVDPAAVDVLKPTFDIRLTLFSCWPVGVDSKRVVISALRSG